MLLILSAGPVQAGDALIAATKVGDLSQVERLLAAGADPDCHDQVRNTALIFAARDGRLGIAQRLIAAGASVNWVDDEQVSPLILAAFKDHPEVVRLLLAKGADTEIRDQWGRRALDYALRRGAADDIAEQIRSAGGAN
ncbi:MAG: ankyrin repeat domain-containing protein [Pseudomonadota bacterium]